MTGPTPAFMFMYADIIQPRHCGDQYNNILSILPLKEVESEYTAIKNVQYFPLNRKEISEISIKLADEYGNPIAVESGYHPTYISLHFKKEV